MIDKNIGEDVFGQRNTRDGINAKKKGNRNESEAAKALTAWVGVKFVRVVGSGALRRNDTSYTCGDIQPDCPGFNFCYSVETKHLKTLTITRFLGSKAGIFKIWAQCHADAIRGGKLPLALLRKNGMPKGEYYAIMDAESALKLSSKITPVLSGSTPKYNIIGFMFSDLKKVNYTKFAAYIEKHNFVDKFLSR